MSCACVQLSLIAPVRVSPGRVSSVVLQRVGLDGRRRVVQSVRVVCGLAGQRARVGQRSRAAVAEEPVR